MIKTLNQWPQFTQNEQQRKNVIDVNFHAYIKPFAVPLRKETFHLNQVPA